MKLPLSVPASKLLSYCLGFGGRGGLIALRGERKGPAIQKSHGLLNKGAQDKPLGQTLRLGTDDYQKLEVQPLPRLH